MALASCENEEQMTGPDETTFYATFEQPEGAATRVYANEDLLLRWHADDRVSIFNKITYNQEYRFSGETGDNAGAFSRVDTEEFVTGNPIPHVVSVYPYQPSTRISEDEVLSVSLPDEQFYAERSFGRGANIMVSVTSDKILQYKNTGGYLVLSLYGENVSVSSIVLKGNDGEKIAGKAVVTMPLDGDPTVVTASDATDTITLTCDPSVPIGATAEACKEFWFVLPPVTFNKGFTITVSGDGGTFVKATEKTLAIERNKVLRMSPIEVGLHFTPTLPVPEIIDLGLSVKWGSFNLGASVPEGIGDYYSWGEIEPKDSYSWETYKWSNGSNNTLTKYCYTTSRGVFGYNGFTDEILVLLPEDDAAHVHLGGNWRMPTKAEQGELRFQCTWTVETVNGVEGRRVTGPNGNSIFLPATGFMGPTGLELYRPGNYQGYYWSASLDVNLYPYTAYFLYFFVTEGAQHYESRVRGQCIRPVYGN